MTKTVEEEKLCEKNFSENFEVVHKEWNAIKRMI